MAVSLAASAKSAKEICERFSYASSRVHDFRRHPMSRAFKCVALVILTIAASRTGASAQTFEKHNYNYSEWARGRFSEAVTVIGPGKMIFLAGVGSEDENGKAGDILYKGDFVGQCKYAYDK